MLPHAIARRKREEAEQIDLECDELEARNSELKEKVDQMTREIGYLKNLLAEVYKARGLMAPKLGKWNHCIVQTFPTFFFLHFGHF